MALAGPRRSSGVALPRRTFNRAGRAVHHREESNDGTHEESPAQLQRRRMGPEPGPGLSRSQDRPVPDGVARERAEAEQVAQAPRLGSGEAAGGPVRRRLHQPRVPGRGGRRARAAHLGTAFFRETPGWGDTGSWDFVTSGERFEAAALSEPKRGGAPPPELRQPCP